ncbi:MAG: DUF3047 domain-containing protein [bacterium]|nr:DUF3047 domain-containing protein [bacterium]
MKWVRFVVLLCVYTISCLGTLYAEAGDAIFSESFDSLTNWEPLTFEKVPKQSHYSVIPNSSGGMILKLESEGGASALISKRIFSVDEARVITWSWRIEEFPPAANPKTKSGDDYPIRMYLIFEYEPDNSSFLMNTKYKAIKALYGKYPPDSSLNYVWSGVEQAGSTFESPYTDRSRIIVLQGRKSAGDGWISETVDPLADYREQFGKEPPQKFRLGIMTDSDNTVGRTRAYFRSLAVLKKDTKAPPHKSREDKN